VARSSVDELAGRRDLREGPGPIGVSLPSPRQARDTIEFYLSPTRNTAAAKRFLGKALKGLKNWEKPYVITTDKAPTYAAALAELKAEGKCPHDTVHRRSNT